MQAEARATISTHGIATAALVVVVGLFVFSSFMTHHYAGWWWAALKAFAEAATVGALADWFAVVALFRHPLGLPIPHTAVLVKKQDSIAKSIASFFCDNFWVPDQVRARLVGMHPSGFLLRMLSRHQGALGNIRKEMLQRLGAFLANEKSRNGVAAAVAGVLPSLPLKEIVCGLVNCMRNSALPSVAADIVVAEAAGYARRNKEIIAGEVAACVDPSQFIPRNLGGVLDVFGGGALQQLGGGVNQVFLASVRTIVGPLVADRVCSYADGIAREPNHRVRLEIRNSILQALTDIAEGNKYDAELSAALAALAGKDSVIRFFDAILPYLQSASAVSSETEEQAIAQRLAHVLNENPELCSALDSAIANLAADLVAQTSDLVASELESTIRSWDMNTMVSKIESQVGDDLQYIRLNGTFVGGLIGIGIFLITTMASAI